MTVASSTILYLNTAAVMIDPPLFFFSPWLNPLVFGINADSVMNDFGLMMMSGIPKLLLDWSLWKSLTTWRLSKNKITNTPMSMFTESQASEAESRREAESVAALDSEPSQKVILTDLDL